MYKPYTGVGSRTTPAEIQLVMMDIGRYMANRGWTLRSGGAIGADIAFERYVPTHLKEVYRPNGERRRYTYHITEYDPELWHVARDIASAHHPAWSRCRPFAKDLHTRNVFQILGHELNDPSRIMICFTHDGAITAEECSVHTGGTGMAIRIACHCNVPVLNLKLQEHLDKVLAKGVSHE